MSEAVLKTSDLYEADFAAWCERQAALARAGRAAELDLANIAEELDGLARSDRREIRNRLRVLIHHLLKWRHQPDQRGSGWIGTIGEQRRRIEAIIEDSPSPAAHPAAVLDRAYADARSDPAKETGLPRAAVPETCPFPLARILDPDWLPD